MPFSPISTRLLCERATPTTYSSVCAILTILNEKSDRLDISFSGSLRHKGNNHGRRVKGIERENFKKELSGAHPSRLHHRLLASLPEKVYASGKRDGVGTQHTLQKISSEKNLRGRPFVDSVQRLAHLRAHFIKDDQLRFPQYLQKESGPHLFGYIQSISLYPTVVTMWTEADLRLYCELCRSGTTGSLTLRANWREKFLKIRDQFCTTL